MDMSSMSGMTMAASSTAMAMASSTGMTMDMGTSTGMAMDMGTATSAAASASSTMDMSSSDMDSTMGGCKISMLWNWYTIDTCFISTTWHNNTRAKFGGSCIGVICLVMVLEALRRAVKEYDRYLIRQHRAKLVSVAGSSNGSKDNVESAICPAGVDTSFRPNVFQQAVRALLHMLQFAVAYFVMLLAMYYNGYIIICIFIGAYLGSFIFQWETLGASAGQTSAAQEATVCCG